MSFEIILKYNLVPWKYFTSTLNSFFFGALQHNKHVKWYVFPNLYWLVWLCQRKRTASNICLTSVASCINKFLWILHLCNKIFLFYKCCYLFWTQIEFFILFAFTLSQFFKTINKWLVILLINIFWVIE